MTTPGDFETTRPRGSTQRGTAGGGQRGEESEGLKESARHLAHDAQEQASNAVQAGVNRGKERLAESLGSVAEALRVSSGHLREQQQDVPRQYIDRAARQVEQLSSYLRRSDLSDMAHSVEDFARRQPAVFLGGAFLLGLLGARFLRSSRRNQYEHSGYPQRGYAAGAYPDGGYTERGYGAGEYSDGPGLYGSGLPTDPEGIGGSTERGFGGSTVDDVSLRPGSGSSTTGLSGSDDVGKGGQLDR